MIGVPVVGLWYHKRVNKEVTGAEAQHGLSLTFNLSQADHVGTPFSIECSRFALVILLLTPQRSQDDVL